ncbi:MAG TPA: pyrroloquinoline quinone biosynthesis protein PqqB [Polyangiaceae bacterium]|nr:pyrroloquinoline quinone biosynthesis protein PqqB [Polyangiaceae bacterium]
MRVRVLGSAAGGGFPQWNCGCSNCRDVRAGAASLLARTQESVAVSADGEHWFLLNASPEVRAQLESFPALHPRGPRQSPIAGILLTNGDLDHCLGLLSLRESQRLSVYATERVRHGFTENNVLYATLQRFPGHTTWTGLKLGEEVALRLDGERPSGLTVEAVPLPGQAPLHLKAKFGEPHPEDNIGLLIREPQRGVTLAYFPGCARVTPAVLEAAGRAQCLFFDGTFWADDELIQLGLGERRATDMAHVAIGSPAGSLAAFASCPVPARWFIHINNTNPILREDSVERRIVREAGWQVARDGLDLTLDGKGLA